MWVDLERTENELETVLADRLVDPLVTASVDGLGGVLYPRNAYPHQHADQQFAVDAVVRLAPPAGILAGCRGCDGH